jgi:hypothetical protein
MPLATREEIESAVQHLSVEADLVVRKTASAVFLSTALMQNGRLDGLIVLFVQIQMVARIARIYVQRPSPRELVRLYANVAGTAFVAQRWNSRAQWHLSSSGEMCFEWRCERVSHAARGRSRASLLRTHVTIFA